LTGGLIAGVLVCALGLARSPQLVSFAPAAQTAQARLMTPSMDLRAVDAARIVQVQSAMLAPEQMVKAIMPSQQLASTAVARPVQRSATLRNVRRRPVQSRQAWIMMTTWTESEAGTQMVLTVAQTGIAQGDQAQPTPRTQERQGRENQLVDRPVRINRVSYAAVPFGNGWLIIQI
jgi:hypothetical protein